MTKIMTIVGTRPEIIKMSRIINEFDLHTDHILVHTGQNFDFELNGIFFDDLDIRKPDFFLDAATSNSLLTISRILEKIDILLEKESPDAILVYGDTNSCLSVIAAKKRKIPIFHFEAGNRCFDQRVPEEINRKIVDHLSDFNMVLTEHARRYLIMEGIRPETIIKTGSHMYEVLNFYKDKILKSNILSKLNLQKDAFFLVSAHREENIDDINNITNLFDSLSLLVEKYNLPIVFTTHPRTKKRLDELNFKNIPNKIFFMKPFNFTDYINLQMNALCILSDSGTITEESDILNLPAINIRNAHERPEGMDAGTLIMSGLKSNNVLKSVEVIINQFSRNNRLTKKISDYHENGQVSKQVLRIVLSNIDYINNTVWKKNFIN